MYGSTSGGMTEQAANTKPRMKMTTNRLLAKFKKSRKLTMVTAYDYPSAQVCDESLMDMILVGDSVAMVVLGQEDTVSVTMNEMVHHCQAVKRGSKFSFLVGDLPFGSYNTVDLALHNATRLLKEGGMDAVKLEGGTRVVPQIKALTSAGMSVIGHIGLTPQSYRSLGGFTVQGKKPVQAQQILKDAHDLVDAGVMAIVLEMLPTSLSKEITAAVSVPTIGIGAGPDTSGQVLVYHDILGLFDKFQPKFSKQYVDLRAEMVKALRSYRAEVLDGSFPSPQHSFEVSAPAKKASLAPKSNIEVAFKRNIMIVGGGAMGSFFAAKLSAEESNKVTLVSQWTEHVDAINTNGLKVRGCDGDSHCQQIVTRRANVCSLSTENVMYQPTHTADVVYILVKSRGTRAAAKIAKSFVKPDGTVITIQNGIGFKDTVQDVFSTPCGDNINLVFGITSYGARVVGPGMVSAAGKGITTLFEPDGPIFGSKFQDAVNDLQSINMDVCVISDKKAAEKLMWRKLAVNAVINPLAALFGVTNGNLISHPPYARVVEALAYEIAGIAESRIDWSGNELNSEVKKVLTVTKDNQNSMLTDIQRDQTTEFEQINGEILKIAKAHGILAPLSSGLAGIFKALAKRDEVDLTSLPASPPPPKIESTSSSNTAVYNSISAFRYFRGSIHRAETVGFVPTMGALHSGHLSLIKAAKEECDRVVVSIFVNPVQFAAHEDFDKYPSSLATDVALLSDKFPDVAVFAPSISEMYPRFKISPNKERDSGQSVFVVPEKVESISAEGRSRPNFFTGVATVCTKLFNIVQPHKAYFGQKDATQVIALQHIIDELNMPLSIKVVETAREADGLAMSSRNVYLSPEDRAVAPLVYKALTRAHHEYTEIGERRVHVLKNNVYADLMSNPNICVDYVSLANGNTAEELSDDTLCPNSTLLSVAVTIGETRLIDNIILNQ